MQKQKRFCKRSFLYLLSPVLVLVFACWWGLEEQSCAIKILNAAHSLKCGAKTEIRSVWCKARMGRIQERFPKNAMLRGLNGRE